jgi:hypothetical protein
MINEKLEDRVKAHQHAAGAKKKIKIIGSIMKG